MCHAPGMQTVRLGALIIAHKGGYPVGVYHVFDDDEESDVALDSDCVAHPVVEGLLLESPEIAQLCRRDAEDNPAELDFDV